MKRTISILSFIVALTFLIPFVRSRELDEGFEFGDESLTNTGYRKEYLFSLGWGPNGIRLFRLLESENVSVGLERYELMQLASNFKRGTWNVWSDPYKEGTSWGWPKDTLWNEHGFWLSDKTFTEDNEWTRQISLIAIPLWLPVAVFSLAGIIGLRRPNQIKKEAVVGAGDAEEAV